MSEADIQKWIVRHAARNRELKQLIESKGADLAGRRIINLHFWSGGEKAARNLAAALQTEGYVVVSRKPSVSDPSLWNVEAQVEGSPLSVTAPLFVERIVRVAAENEGEFDGWGTSI
ncbi:MAG: ribonuclease E inhibitor RraB [Acidobacteriota bacterium]|nr:ribonuclease E inhibitor RraB [Acidobacteriota bacterium]